MLDDGYALVSQLNELREEFLKAKSEFEEQFEDMKKLHKMRSKLKMLIIPLGKVRMHMRWLRINSSANYLGGHVFSLGKSWWLCLQRQSITITIVTTTTTIIMTVIPMTMTIH